MEFEVRGAHLVGSIPLDNATNVFTTASEALGPYLRRIPDGETGDRTNWIVWQFPLFLQNESLQTYEQEDGYGGPAGMQVGIRDGCQANDIKFGPLGYAKSALESYEIFRTLKRAGDVPEHCRFQVCLPTPTAPVHLCARVEDQRVLERVYEDDLMEELIEIIEIVPHDQLAIQWDTAVEFGIIEGCFPTYLSNPLPDIVERLVSLGNSVPRDIEMGYHLCYGDSEHEHFVEPKDMTHLVAVASSVADQLSRPLNWIHFPVPIERDDEEYFEPARSLNLSAATEIYLGLIHTRDGTEGALRRIKAAQSQFKQFGVATECGLGRRSPEIISDLLELHSSIASEIQTGERTG